MPNFERGSSVERAGAGDTDELAVARLEREKRKEIKKIQQELPGLDTKFGALEEELGEMADEAGVAFDDLGEYFEDLLNELEDEEEDDAHAQEREPEGEPLTPIDAKTRQKEIDDVRKKLERYEEIYPAWEEIKFPVMSGFQRLFDLVGEDEFREFLLANGYDAENAGLMVDLFDRDGENDPFDR